MPHTCTADKKPTPGTKKFKALQRACSKSHNKSPWAHTSTSHVKLPAFTAHSDSDDSSETDPGSDEDMDSEEIGPGSEGGLPADIAELFKKNHWPLFAGGQAMLIQVIFHCLQKERRVGLLILIQDRAMLIQVVGHCSQEASLSILISTRGMPTQVVSSHSQFVTLAIAYCLPQDLVHTGQNQGSGRGGICWR
ncbi:hypothetical protein BDR04DRAFT_1120325 [Suillus decipiens]|nr:hypothetical protein BDR04DRAFT_1120325 [Suillus decipiens]